MVTAAWRRSRPRPCCTSDQGWRTGWPISTTRVAQRRRSSISSVTTRRTMRNMMPRLHLMFTVLPALPKPTRAVVSGAAMDQAAAALGSGRKTMMLIRGAALKERGLNAAGRVAAATGARIACDTFAPRCQRGAGRVQVERIPYFAEQIVEFMNGTEQLILVGAKPPVSFFAYPEKPSCCTPESCRILYLAHAHANGPAALEALADAVRAAEQPLRVGPFSKPDIPVGPPHPLTAAPFLSHYLPAGAIISDEGATAGGGVHRFAANIEPHDHLALTGVAIGQGIPVATGAQVACQDRSVDCLHGHV